jgi:hypothetical protein
MNFRVKPRWLIFPNGTILLIDDRVRSIKMQETTLRDNETKVFRVIVTYFESTATEFCDFAEEGVARQFLKDALIMLMA